MTKEEFLKDTKLKSVPDPKKVRNEIADSIEEDFANASKDISPLLKRGISADDPKYLDALHAVYLASEQGVENAGPMEYCDHRTISEFWERDDGEGIADYLTDFYSEKELKKILMEYCTLKELGNAWSVGFVLVPLAFQLFFSNLWDDIEYLAR